MPNYKKEFLEDLINHYQPMSAAQLTLEDGREIADNLLALGKWIIKARRKMREKMANAFRNIRVNLDYINPFSKSKAAKIWQATENMNRIHSILGIYCIADTTGMLPEKINKKHCEYPDPKHAEVFL